MFRFMHTNTFCKYRKKLLASPRVHLVYVTVNISSCYLRYPDSKFKQLFLYSLLYTCIGISKTLTIVRIIKIPCR